jgi:hypothetical protein
MIRFFSANHLYHFFLIPVIGALIFFSTLNQPINDLFLAFSTQSSPFSVFLSNSILPANIGLALNFVLVMIICFQLLQINARFSFVKERSFLPAYLYLFLTLALPGLRIFHPVYVAAIFLLLAINRIFASLEQPKAILNAFDAALFTGLASLFYIHAIVFLFMIPIGLYMLRLKTIWNEWVASFIGALIPWIFILPLLIIAGGMRIFRYFPDQFIFIKNNFYPENPFIIAFFAFYLLMILFASIFILRSYHTQKISSRRYYKILFYFFTFCNLLILFPPVSYEVIVLAAIPISFLFTNYLISVKRRRLANMLFAIMMIITLTLHFFV